MCRLVIAQTKQMVLPQHWQYWWVAHKAWQISQFFVQMALAISSAAYQVICIPHWQAPSNKLGVCTLHMWLPNWYMNVKPLSVKPLCVHMTLWNPAPHPGCTIPVSPCITCSGVEESSPSCTFHWMGYCFSAQVSISCMLQYIRDIIPVLQTTWIHGWVDWCWSYYSQVIIHLIKECNVTGQVQFMDNSQPRDICL